MKILLSLTYFEPYHSGLSVYAYRLAQGLSELGHEVTVLTSQYQTNLLEEEHLGAVRVVRVPVGLKLSKGVIMPRLRDVALPLIQWADVVNLHLPQFESYWLSAYCRRLHKPLVVTYHCDLVMQGGLLKRFAGWGTQLLQNRPLNIADRIVQNSVDYAQNSPALRPRMAKVVAVPPPVIAQKSDPEAVLRFKHKHAIQPDQRVLGMAGRVATEKGVEYLLEAFPEILRKFPKARILHAGAWQSVIGEEAYQERVERMAKPFGGKFEKLGFLDDDEFSAFFAACDLLVFSSLNATESFGIVQVEAMAQETPIVATNLPGVRQPVLQTTFGCLVPPRDGPALANAICAMLEKPPAIPAGLSAYLAQFIQANVARQYETLFNSLIRL